MVHLEENGYEVEKIDKSNNELTALNASLGIPIELTSCHTAQIEGYIVEGHVPADVIEQILQKMGPTPQLFNLNIPTVAMTRDTEVRVVPMDVTRFDEHFVKRKDPKGRNYYWVAGEIPPSSGSQESDLTALGKGHITLTPLQYDMTQRTILREMESWRFRLPHD